MSIYARRKEWEELQYLGLGLSNSLQISLDMINSTMKSSYEANITSQESMDLKIADEFSTLSDQIAKESILQYDNKKESFDTAISGSSSFLDPSYKKMLESEKFAQSMIEEHTKIAIDSFESSFGEQIKTSMGYVESLKSDYEQAMEKKVYEFPTLNDQIVKEFILQYDNKKELFDTAISGSSPFSDASYKMMLEAEKFEQSMIEEHTKIAIDSFESSFGEQIKASILDPAMGYVDEMQKMLNEPMLKMREYATIGLNSIEEIQKLQEIPYQVELDKLTHDMFLEESITSMLKNSSIADMSHLATATYDSYKHIHNILDHDSISSLVPKNIDSLVQNLINTESMTQHYLHHTRTKAVDVSIEEYDVWSKLELIRTDIVESLENGNKQIEQLLNQILKVLYDFISIQNDPKVILFILNILLTVILSIISAIIFEYYKPQMNFLVKIKDQKVVKKELIHGIKNYLPSQKMRVKYRLVTANSLNVRDGKSIKTTVIGHLEFANIVEIIKKEKNWALIKRYDGNSETVIQGWVFTRYLAQIK